MSTATRYFHTREREREVNTDKNHSTHTANSEVNMCSDTVYLLHKNFDANIEQEMIKNNAIECDPFTFANCLSACAYFDYYTYLESAAYSLRIINKNASFRAFSVCIRFCSFAFVCVLDCVHLVGSAMLMLHSLLFCCRWWWW